MTNISYSRNNLGQMDSSMESYEVSHLQDREQGETRRKMYYCNMHGYNTRFWFDAVRLQIK